MTRWTAPAAAAALACAGISYFVGRGSGNDNEVIRQPAKLKELNSGPVSRYILSERQSTPQRLTRPSAIAAQEINEGTTPIGDAGGPAAAKNIANMTFEEIRAYESDHEQRLYRRLDARFSGQKPDRSWRQSAEERLSGAFRSIGSKTVEISSVECRSDICMTELSHDGRRLPGGFISKFIRQFIPGFEHVIRYEDGLTTVYSLRRDDALTTDEP